MVFNILNINSDKDVDLESKIRLGHWDWELILIFDLWY